MDRSTSAHMHDPNTICPWHTDGRGIKKEKEEGGWAAEISDFFIKNSESKSKKTKNLLGGGGRCD